MDRRLPLRANRPETIESPAEEKGSDAKRDLHRLLALPSRCVSSRFDAWLADEVDALWDRSFTNPRGRAMFARLRRLPSSPR